MRLNGFAAAAALCAFTAAAPAKAVEIYRFEGLWEAQVGGATAYAGYGLFGPGDYIVKWWSPAPFGEGSFLTYDFSIHEHYETYEGEVLFDAFSGDTIWPIDLPVGSRSYSVRTQIPAVYVYQPSYFGFEIWQEGYAIRAFGGPEAAGQPFVFSVATVPEPATWSLAILGFLAVGGALRRRRRAAAWSAAPV